MNTTKQTILLITIGYKFHKVIEERIRTDRRPGTPGDVRLAITREVQAEFGKEYFSNGRHTFPPQTAREALDTFYDYRTACNKAFRILNATCHTRFLHPPTPAELWERIEPLLKLDIIYHASAIQGISRHAYIDEIHARFMPFSNSGCPNLESFKKLMRDVKRNKELSVKRFNLQNHFGNKRGNVPKEANAAFIAKELNQPHQHQLPLF